MNSVYLNREFACTQKELFQWLVKPELLVQWFGPKHLKVTNVENDLRLGGHYRIKMQTEAEGHFYIAGQYLEIEEYSRLRFSFAYEGGKTMPPPSTVSMSLEELGPNRSRLSFVQQFEVDPGDMDKRTVAWNYMLDKLNRLI